MVPTVIAREKTKMETTEGNGDTSQFPFGFEPGLEISSKALVTDPPEPCIDPANTITEQRSTGNSLIVHTLVAATVEYFVSPGMG